MYIVPVLLEDPWAVTRLQRKTARSITEFVSVVDSLRPSSPSGLWFRGQSCSWWDLQPKVLRELKPLTDGRGNPVTSGTIVRAGGGEMTGPNPERMLAIFKQRARPYIRSMPTNDFEWMFLAQHHGLPTRLLDWSTNALVALYFALEGAREENLDGEAACNAFLEANADAEDQGVAVFSIDPGEVNSEVVDVAAPIDIAARPEYWSHYLDPVAAGLTAYLPICVTAPHATERIRAQSGTFTLHGSNVWPLDQYFPLQPLITKIFLPYSATTELKNALLRLGMTRGFIYADLDSVAADVVELEKRMYQLERLKHDESIRGSQGKAASSAKTDRR